MAQNRFDISIEIAGGLLWLAPRSLGGYSPKAFSNLWMGEGGSESIEDLIKRGAMMPLSLYQDDGYTIRFVHGDLTQQEQEEWTAHASMNLQIPCGELLVSGVLTPDFETLEFPEMQEFQKNSSTQFGGYLKLKPGPYRIDVYCYPPGDLSGGWGHIVEHRDSGKQEGIEPEEAPKYFKRTRPGENHPRWLTYEDDESIFVDFLIQITAFDKNIPAPTIADEGIGVAWEFRKPARCPLGILSTAELE